uniref:Si:dkeyp-72e1.6 n=1 Tax=Eptatretus burgeri TaxID=7764 RepID=A0A8C4QZJ3_EPTBU
MVCAWIGRCASAFWLAVSFDVLGAALLVCGLFIEVTFYDLLIYLGAIFIFLSIVWWIFWYTGNIEIPMCELDDRPRKPNAFRRLSRLSRRVAASFRQNSQRGQKDVSGRPRTTARGSDKRSDKRKGKKVTIQEPEKWRLRGAEVADEPDQSTTQL